MTRISSRARFAPRQKCGPPAPKAMCGFGERVMSKVWGSSKTVSSRLAEMWKKTTFVSSSMTCPPSSKRSVVCRRKFMTGVT